MTELAVSLFSLEWDFPWFFVRGEPPFSEAVFKLPCSPARVSVEGKTGSGYGSGFSEPVLRALFIPEGNRGDLDGNSSRFGLGFALCFGFVLGGKVGGLKTFSRLIGLKRSHWFPGATLPCITLLFHSGVACGLEFWSGDGREGLYCTVSCRIEGREPVDACRLVFGTAPAAGLPVFEGPLSP